VRWLPKSYSEEERAYIVKRLKEEATDCLSRYGVKKTTVDELVRRVKIPKGTFYLFYQSKELLLFEVFLELHEKIEQQLLDGLAQIEKDNITLEQMTDMIFRFYKVADESPLIKLLTSGDIDVLARKLPKEVVTEHFEQDDFLIEKIFSLVPDMKDKDVETFSTAFRNIFFTMIYKKELGEKNYDESLKMLIRGLVIQLLE
jgi:AcrR family transcriptional regulator